MNRARKSRKTNKNYTKISINSYAQNYSTTLIDFFDGDVGPEVGVTYTLRIYGENDTLGRTVTGISTNSYIYTENDEKNDFEIVTGTQIPAMPDPTHAYSLQKIVSSYSGPAIRVRRSSDNSEQDIGFSGTVLDSEALLTFVGAGDGFVKIIYDQKESQNFTQSTASLQPLIVSSGSLVSFGGIPGIQGDGTDDYLLSATLPSNILDDDSTVLNVFVSQFGESLGGLFAEQSVSFSGRRIAVFSDTRSTPRRHSVYSPDAVDIYTDFATQQPTDTCRQFTTIHRNNDFIARAESSSIDTAAVSALLSTSTRFELLRQQAGPFHFDGIWHETVIYTSALAGTDLDDAENSQLNRYLGEIDSSTDFRLNGRLRFELESVREESTAEGGDITSMQHYDVEVRRPGWNFNWNMYWNGEESS